MPTSDRGPSADGDRRQVTAMFADLAGYTAMSEALDPEELRDVMSMVFGEIAQIIASYEGHVEKFIGDAVMAVFGIPTVHEDDPVRAVKAALGVHTAIQRFSVDLEPGAGRPLAMHTGINTGLVVASEANGADGTARVLGDTLNVASRLASLARPGEILVGEDTYRHVCGRFELEPLGPVEVKGRAAKVRPYRVVRPKAVPTTIHGLAGRRAELVGRSEEMDQLKEAADRLVDGKRTIVSIRGGPGSGKSRLVEEFKQTLDLEKVQWREGRSYAYTSNIPYYPLIDLIGRAWGIAEGDDPEVVRANVAGHLERLLGTAKEHAPVLGSLLGLDYPELKKMDPALWKQRLTVAIDDILEALARAGPAVICLQDIHWADPSSVSLLRGALARLRHAALFICTYRPPFALLSSHEEAGLASDHRLIDLADLSPTEAHCMTLSLLGVPEIPSELRGFIRDKAEGNPFYLEEMVNSLLESSVLVPGGDGVALARPLLESEMPLTIRGVLSARLERLDPMAKRVLREASVIGRVFSRDTLMEVTAARDELDRCLSDLEQLDLVRTQALEPEHEYAFKHALTQDVAYEGLLRVERQEIHDRVARVIETRYEGRRPEVFETLAHHYTLGRSVDKAVHYLALAGGKAAERYALEEAHRYYEQAVRLLQDDRQSGPDSLELLADVLLKWVLVYYYRGDFVGLSSLLREHEGLLDLLVDESRIGMWHVWLGMDRFQHERPTEAFGFLTRALAYGEETRDEALMGNACTWLAYVCADTGRLDQAVEYGERAVSIGRTLGRPDYPYHIALGGLGYAHWVRGDRGAAHDAGRTLIDHGREVSDARSLVFGHWVVGMSHIVDGDFEAAIEANDRAIQVSVDPWYAQFPRMFLGMSYVAAERFQEAEAPLKELMAFCDDYGGSTLGTPSEGLLAIVQVANGQMGRGVRTLEDLRERWRESGCMWRCANADFFLGSLYLRLAERSAPLSLPVLARNLGFLAKTVPFARSLAKGYLEGAIEGSREIGAKCMLGQAHMAMGRLEQACGRGADAAACFEEAAACFEAADADTFLGQAKARLAAVAGG